VISGQSSLACIPGIDLIFNILIFNKYSVEFTLLIVTENCLLVLLPPDLINNVCSSVPVFVTAGKRATEKGVLGCGCVAVCVRACRCRWAGGRNREIL
jgi:hypothetical protein